MNPGKETLNELWEPHGNSTFEGYLGNEGATKSTTYSRYAIVAWPAVHGVEMACQYINVNAAVETLLCQRPVIAPTLRNFMDVVSAKLAEKDKSYSWRQSNALSVGFCRALCELLVEADDPSLVRSFFEETLSKLGNSIKDQLVAPLTTLVRTFDWSDIGQALLKTLSDKTNHRDENLNFGLRHEEETDDTCMKVALYIVNGLESGVARQALLEKAVEEALRLRPDKLCSSKAVDLLCKWTIQSGDKTSFDTVASTFKQIDPKLLQPVVEAFSQHATGMDASDERFAVIVSIAKRRCEWLNDQLQALGKPFSWEMPDAYFPDNAKVQAFLRGPDASMKTVGVRQFNGVRHARNYANKWMRGQQINASYTLEPDGRGQSAYVTIKKTRAWFSEHQKKLLEYKTEFNLLSTRFEDASAGISSKRARYE